MAWSILESAFPEARRAARRFGRSHAASAGAYFLVALLGAAALAPIVAPWDPLAQNLSDALAAPSTHHVLGTDDLGRDVLSRLLHGARLSLAAACLAVAIAALSGIPVGLLAGYTGGRLDDFLMRLVDAVQAFPALVLAMAIAAALGPGLGNVMVAVGVVYIPRFARLVRGQTLSLREEIFVEAARAAGATHGRILLRHILPNVAAPIIVQVSVSVAFALLAETSLSFLGIGIKPPTPSWGADVGRGYRFMRLAPWLVFMPGLAILLTALAFNFLGDGFRDALDPKHARTEAAP